MYIFLRFPLVDNRINHYIWHNRQDNESIFQTTKHSFAMEITHHPERHLFETTTDGFTAHVEYTVSNDRLIVLHTIVPKEIGGRGIAGELVKAAFDYARQKGLQPAAICSYALLWLQRHPDYATPLS